MFIQKNEVTLFDSVVWSIFSEFIEYFTIDNIIDNIIDQSLDDNNVLLINIKLDKQTQKNERKVQNCLTILYEVGGLWSVMYGLGFGINHVINNLTIKISYINNLYQVKKSEQGLDEAE